MPASVGGGPRLLPGVHIHDADPRGLFRGNKLGGLDPSLRSATATSLQWKVLAEDKAPSRCTGPWHSTVTADPRSRLSPGGDSLPLGLTGDMASVEVGCSGQS